MNRRSFLAGLLASVAAPAAAFGIPVIYGDGIRDDCDGLQALIDGRPHVNLTGVRRLMDGSLMTNCRFRLQNGPIYVQNIEAFHRHFKNCTFPSSSTVLAIRHAPEAS